MNKTTKMMEEASKPLLPKFCKDCKYHRLPWHEKLTGMSRFAKCAYGEKEDQYFLVTGKSYDPVGDNYCSVMRMFACGKEGRFWESK